MKKTHYFFLILFLSLGLKSCSIFNPDDNIKAYKTFYKTENWKVTKLTISKYQVLNIAQEPTLVWDTVLYNYGTFKFEKGSVDEFKSVFTLNSGKTVDLTHAVSGSLEDDDLYLDFKITVNGSAYMPPHGRGYLDAKKGKRINIRGEKDFWDLNYSADQHYPYAEFLTEEAYYKCDWELEAN